MVARVTKAPLFALPSQPSPRSPPLAADPRVTRVVVQPAPGVR